MSLFTILYERFAPFVVIDDALAVVVAIDDVEDNEAKTTGALDTVLMVDVVLMTFSFATGSLFTENAAVDVELKAELPTYYENKCKCKSLAC